MAEKNNKSDKIKKTTVKKAKKQVAKEVRKGFHFIPLKYQLIAVVILLLAVGGITLIPEDAVPSILEKPHTFLLSKRNKLIRTAGLPFSGYEDVYSITNPGSDPVRIFLAPSPKIAAALDQFIRSAVHSVDVCAFDIKLDEIADALIEVHRSGVKVRIVTETDYLNNEALMRMSKTGLPIKSDHRSGLMHNKFVIVDSRYLWTGSFNLTPNGKNRNDNNAILIESPSVAKGYKARFEQYWNEHFGTSGKSSQSNSGYIGRMPVQFAFSPTDCITDILLKELSLARRSVDVMAFSFTGADLAAKLRDLHQKGVRIRCLFDYGQAKNKASRDEFLRKIGAKVYYSPNRIGKMHHKVFIIDGRTVVTGSFNFSKNAEKKNDENIIVLQSEEIAAVYTKEMNRCIKGIKGY